MPCTPVHYDDERLFINLLACHAAGLELSLNAALAIGWTASVGVVKVCCHPLANAAHINSSTYLQIVYQRKYVDMSISNTDLRLTLCASKC